MPGLGFVVASREFQYDEGAVGRVKRQQIFRMQGHPNDQRLLEYRHMTLLDPQPENLAGYPQCPVCGRRFTQPLFREQCAASHEMSEAEVIAARHEQAADRLARAGA